MKLKFINWNQLVIFVSDVGCWFRTQWQCTRGVLLQSKYAMRNLGACICSREGGQEGDLWMDSPRDKINIERQSSAREVLIVHLPAAKKIIFSSALGCRERLKNTHTARSLCINYAAPPTPRLLINTSRSFFLHYFLSLSCYPASYNRNKPWTHPSRKHSVIKDILLFPLTTAAAPLCHVYFLVLFVPHSSVFVQTRAHIQIIDTVCVRYCVPGVN